MSITQITPTDSFSQIINKINKVIGLVSGLSPSSLEVISINSPTNNQILRYNSTSSYFTNVSLLGTTNRITVTHNANNITISTPQDIHTGASPQFAGLTLSSPLGISSGGTGASTAVAARTALLPSQSGQSGKFLKTNGTDVVWDTITVATPGADKQVIFNDGGSTLSGDSVFYFDKTLSPKKLFVPSIECSYGYFSTNLTATDVVVNSFRITNPNEGVKIDSDYVIAKNFVRLVTNGSVAPVIDMDGTTVLSKTALNVGPTGTITGIIQTSSQPNITSLGNLTSLTVAGITTLQDTVRVRSGKSIEFYNTANTAKVTVRAKSTLPGDVEFILPISNPTAAGQILAANESGEAVWINPTGATNPAGTNTAVQFNDGGIFGGNASTFSFNKNTSTLTVAGSVVTGSDIAFKTDITEIKSPIEIISKLNGKYYYRTDIHRRQYGLIAQDVQKVLPEIVDFCGEYLGISYQQLIPILIEAVKELHRRVS